MEEKKTRKSPTPQNFENIKRGALNLPLKDRVDLKNLIADSIETELKKLEETLMVAKTLVNGKQ